MLLPLVAACGLVDEVGRTRFQVPEAQFRVAATAEDPLQRVVELERDVSLASSEVGGSSNLDSVRVEEINVAVYTNSLPAGISSVQFIVEPVDPVTYTVFATIEDIDPGSTDWPEPQISEQGRDHLAAFIGTPQASFRLRATLAFDVEPDEVIDHGTLDLRLRIHASALAAQ